MIARANPDTLPMLHGQKLIVDLFAGCGGASIGIERAFTKAGLDRYVDIAVNHDPTAIACHELNHPHTRHYVKDVFEVHPLEATGGLPVGYLHLSPDCTHHSKARGGKPVKKNIRGLAWVGVKWARIVRPDVITLENVEEFKDWCPLDEHGRPIKEKKGQTFRSWVAALERLGYVVEWRELRACDYGAPTTRKRLFVIARCDGKPIIWPEATHGDNSCNYRSSEKATKNNGDNTKRDADSASTGSLGASTGGKNGQIKPSGQTSETQRTGECCATRLNGTRTQSAKAAPSCLKPYLTAADCIDFDMPALSIFATPEQARAFSKQHGVGVPRRPLKPKTLTRIAHGLVRYVIDAAEPFIVPMQNHGWGDKCTATTKPLRTITAGPKGGGLAGADAVIAPITVPRHGERPGQKPRAGQVDRPLPTITGTANGAVLVSAFLSKHYSGVIGHGVQQPIGTVTGVDHHSLTTATLVGVGGRAGQSRPRGVDEPMATTTSKADTALASAHLIKLKGTCKDGQPIDQPAPTILAGGTHVGLIYGFLTKYYGSGGQWQGCDEPVHTIPSKGRFNLVLVHVQGEPYVIVDICMRMLAPRELARAQGFPEDYVIDRGADGQRLSKAAQVKLIGNSVPPDFEEAIVSENVVKQGVLEIQEVAA